LELEVIVDDQLKLLADGSALAQLERSCGDAVKAVVECELEVDAVVTGQWEVQTLDTDHLHKETSSLGALGTIVC
jgi:hypothetical protein